MSTSHPPGTLGVLSGELSRWSWFAQALRSTRLPEGSQILWCSAQWIAGAINEMIAQMDPASAWLSIVADDHQWEPDLFLRLLDHQLPIVGPLVNLRSVPFGPSLFHAQADGEYQAYAWEELQGKTGLLPIDTCGGPLAVIRREVLDALGAPWFQNQPGQLVYPHEDLYFFNRARLAGFQPYVDLDQPIWHCFAARGRPTRLPDGTYGIEIASHEVLGVLPGQQQTTNAGATYHAYT
jgi:hypothetical protein